MNDLITQLALMLGSADPAQRSPIPAPMSPVPPGAGFPAPVRPAGLPGLPAQNFSPVPPGALGSQRLAEPDAAPPPPSPDTDPEPEEFPTRPAVPASMLDQFAEMFRAGEDPSSLSSDEPQGGLRGLLTDAAAGMANIRPTAPPGAAFGQGFAASFGANNARRAKAAEAREKSADKAYGRKKDMLELGFKFGDERRADAKEVRDARRAKLDDAKTAMELMSHEAKTEIGKLRADLKAGSITQEDFDAAMSKHMPQTIERIRSKLSGMASGQNAEDVLNPGELKVYNDWLSQKQPWYMQDEPSVPEDGGGAAPAAPTPAPLAPEAAPPAPNRNPGGGSEVPVSQAPATAPTPPTPATPGGDGSSADKPLAFAPGEDAVAKLQAAPAGAFFVNPKDGRVYRKK